MADSGQFIKSPTENYSIGIDYANKLPQGSALLSGTWTAINQETGQDESGIIFVSSIGMVTGDVVTVALAAAGASGTDYEVSVLAETNNGEHFRDAVIMTLR